MVGKHGMVLPTLSDIKSDLDTDRFPTRLSGALTSIPSSLGLPPVPDPKPRPFHGVVIGGWEENHRHHREPSWKPKKSCHFFGKKLGNNWWYIISDLGFRKIDENGWEWIKLGSNVFQCLDSGRSFFLTPTSHVIAIAIAIPSVAPGHRIRCLGVLFCHVLSNDTQGLVNVPFWEFWTSLSNICWRLYRQYLGDVHLGHLPTPDTGKADNVV